MSKPNQPLKPCPFCGARALFQQIPPDPPEIMEEWYEIRCEHNTKRSWDRGIECPGDAETFGVDADALIAGWNSRDRENVLLCILMDMLAEVEGAEDRAQHAIAEIDVYKADATQGGGA